MIGGLWGTVCWCYFAGGGAWWCSFTVGVTRVVAWCSMGSVGGLFSGCGFWIWLWVGNVWFLAVSCVLGWCGGSTGIGVVRAVGFVLCCLCGGGRGGRDWRAGGSWTCCGCWGIMLVVLFGCLCCVDGCWCIMARLGGDGLEAFLGWVMG